MAQSSLRSSKLAYRADVDGLRAVAVLLVLGDHFRTHLSGGYVGVDVFFVISGYLISAAILKEMGNGTFSIVNFYERRIRRIFPALLVMLLGTCGLAYHFLFPTETVEFGRSLLAAMYSVSNFLFWHQAGYFDAPSAFKPLLHTWSLAVEEQFYLVFPLFLMLIRRFARAQLKRAILAVAGITFVLAILCVRRDATAAFFFSPLRAWELLVGTVVSQHYLPAIRSAGMRHAASLAGLLLIVVPALRYTDKTAFPGLGALPPCLGAALIIAAGETGGSLVGSMLSLRPVVFVGLISYSLYLWHFPVLVFQNIGGLLFDLPGNDRRLKLALFAVSLALGALSWRFVETPFRNGRLRPGRRGLFLINGVGVLAVTAMGVAVVSTAGLPGRFPAEALRAAGYLKYDERGPYREGVCFVGGEDTFANFDQARCLHDGGVGKNILLLGDSHAAQLWPGLSAVFPQARVSQATIAFCQLFVTVAPGDRAVCKQFSAFVYKDYLLHHRVDAVLFAGRWTEEEVPELGRTVTWMKEHGIEVYLFGPMVEYDEPFPRLLAVSLRDGRPGLAGGHMERWTRDLDEEIGRLARESWGVRYVSFYDDLCTPECAVYASPGVPVMFDTHHLTADGSVLLVRRMAARGEGPFAGAQATRSGG